VVSPLMSTRAMPSDVAPVQGGAATGLVVEALMVLLLVFATETRKMRLKAARHGAV
jgi:hypothetical protein